MLSENSTFKWEHSMGTLGIYFPFLPRIILFTCFECITVKPSWMSSVYRGSSIHVSERGNDGVYCHPTCPLGLLDHHYTAATNMEKDPYWTVDLLASHIVHALLFFNRNSGNISIALIDTELVKHSLYVQITTDQSISVFDDTQ